MNPFCHFSGNGNTMHNNQSNVSWNVCAQATTHINVSPNENANEKSTCKKLLFNFFSPPFRFDIYQLQKTCWYKKGSFDIGI